MRDSAETVPSRQIAENLRADIASGVLPPGGRLPPVRDLAESYGVSRNTATKAIAILKAEGLVTARPGSGAYVREPYPIRRLGPDRYARHRWQITTVDAYADTNKDSASAQQQGGQTQEVDLVEADEAVAAALGVDVGSQVYERARVMTRGGVPTHTMASYYRQEDVEGTSIVDSRPGIAGRGGGFAVLAERGFDPNEITEDLSARMPTTEEALLLELPAGEPVVEVRRTTRTVDGRVIEYARGVHAASRFTWSYTYPIPD
ncbi:MULTISPECIES: GntR family transcriptional regulator [Streptosporangium]|uniref:GntR family transcriptional regulator n=1 Tax=Streptosporangium brasiliense TaxID=47480 RepID=A0ABT9RMG1_9ACTN|nr:GntR family transcriptional regulator [Streptosporangium brasiliense]MDP9870482.1 GntR family transcriptional regulator [Streptosporangium brasiliense]